MGVPTERWADVVGFEGRYKVSSFGNIMALPIECPNSKHRYRPGGIRKLQLSRGCPYLTVCLNDGVSSALFYVHDVVLAAFIGPKPLGHCARHGPLGSLVNTIDNLQYGTYSQNVLDKKRDGTFTCNEKPLLCGDGKIYKSAQDARRQTGIHASNISEACRGIRKTAGGFTWSYLEKKCGT